MTGFIGESEDTRKLLELLTAAREASVNALLWGPPGVGKTAIIKELARRENAELRILIGSTMDPTDVAGLPMLSTSPVTHQPITQNTMPEWAEALTRAVQEGRGAFLFLDEISTTTPAVQAALLSLVQGRKVGQYTLPDEVWIIACANAAEDAADGWLLSPPMANRFLHIDYVFSKEDWFAGMKVGFGKPVISESEQEIRNLIVGFLQNSGNGDLLSKMPETEEERGKAWPSPRTWDQAASLMGHISDTSIQARGLYGFVGDKAGRAFELWRKNLKLPRYSDVIANPERFDWKKFKADEVFMILTSVVDNVNAENLGKSVEVFRVANEDGGRSDIAASLVIDLVKKARQSGGLQPDALKKHLLPLMLTFQEQIAAAGLQN